MIHWPLVSEPDAIVRKLDVALAVNLQRACERKLAALDALKQAILHEALASTL